MTTPASTPQIYTAARLTAIGNTVLEDHGITGHCQYNPARPHTLEVHLPATLDPADAAYLTNDIAGELFITTRHAFTINAAHGIDTFQA